MKGTPTIRSILHFSSVVLFLLLPCLALAEEPIPTTTDPADSPMEFEAGEIIVKFKDGIPQAGILQSLLFTEDVNILDRMDNLGLMLLAVPKGQELEKIEELKRNPLVEYAESNGVVQVADTIAVEFRHSFRSLDVIPDDPRYAGQWNLPRIEAPAAWDVTTGSNEVIIAFVDSGIDLDHPELRDRIWTNDDPPGDADGDGDPDDDQNGYVDDVHGWDFVNTHGEPQDDYWHGTFIGSIAAPETNNGDGMAGVSWGAKIMPVKVFDDQWYSQPWHITGGVYYAADNGAKIINLSWRLTGTEYPQALQTAVDYAYSQGVLVVAAAGDSFNSAHKYPAALNHVVSVAATDRDDGHPDFSTYNEKVDVTAPGVDILGIASPLGFEYGRLTSTEAATPHVSGLAALIWSVNPTLTPDEVESIIESTAVDLGASGRDDKFGYGRIDAGAAVMTTTHYLEIEPDDGLHFLVCDDCEPSSREITNPNTSCSTWSVTAIAPWLSISSCEGYTPSSVTVSINKDGLADYGVYTAVITATSTMASCVNNPKTITATAIYTQCWRNYLPLLFKGS